MSLILDALRKSEAERRRGQAPDLFAPMSMPSTRRRPHRIWPWTLAGLSMLGITACGLWLWLGSPTPSILATDIAEQAPETTPLGTATLVDRPIPAALLQMPPPVRPKPIHAMRELPVVAVVAPLDPIALPATVSRPPDSEAVPENVPDPDSWPSIATLPSTERTALPPFKLSMHVWDGEAGKRFAIIDGQRVTEGSSLSGTVVAQIRRDGVVLDINGRHVLLPRP